MKMKAAMILLVIACRMACGQSQPQSRQWLRVGLELEAHTRMIPTGDLQPFAIYDLTSSTRQQIQELFTRQLRKLGDVEVVPDSNEVDVKMKVLVSEVHSAQELLRRPTPARRYAIAVIATSSVDKQTTRSKAAAAWLVVADEKDLENASADLVSKFDHEVLEADRKRIRFPEPAGRSGSSAAATDQFPEPPPAKAPTSGGGNDCDLKPVLIHKVEPKVSFSDSLLKRVPLGDVLLSVEVDPAGHVVNPIVVRSLDMPWNERAIEAVLQWRFRPGTDSEGKPVSCHATITVSFYGR